MSGVHERVGCTQGIQGVHTRVYTAGIPTRVYTAGDTHQGVLPGTTGCTTGYHRVYYRHHRVYYRHHRSVLPASHGCTTGIPWVRDGHPMVRDGHPRVRKRLKPRVNQA